MTDTDQTVQIAVADGTMMRGPPRPPGPATVPASG